MACAAWLLNLGFAGSLTAGPILPPVSVESADVRIEASGEVSQFEIVGAVPGLVVVQGAGRNGSGMGRLQIVAGEAQWRAPNSMNFGPAVDVSATGSYHLYDGDDGDKWVRVQSSASFLPGGATSAPVYLADRYETIFSAELEVGWNQIAGDDVTAAEAAAGDVETWDFQVANRNLDYGILALVAWIDPAVTWIEIAAAPGGPWVSPATEGAALGLGDLAPNSTVTLYVRRTVPASTPFDPAKLVLFHFAWNAF